MLPPVRFWHQHADILSHDFGFGIAKEPLCYRAKILDDTLAINDDHRVRHRSKNGVQISLFISQYCLTSCQGFVGGTKLIYRPLVMKVIGTDCGG